MSRLLGLKSLNVNRKKKYPDYRDSLPAGISFFHINTPLDRAFDTIINESAKNAKGFEYFLII